MTFEQLTKQFQQAKNQDNAQKMSAYMKDKFMFFGIPSKGRRTLYKDMINQSKKEKIIDWSLLYHCFEQEHREYHYFVADYLEAHQKQLVYEDIVKMMPFVKTKQWWDTIDRFARIIGRIGLHDNRVADLMLSWSMDEDIWLNRIAIDHQLGRKAQTDTVLLEKIILNNLGTNEFFINKAIGWSLRDYSKHNAQWVNRFIEQYGEKMSSLSLREAKKYL